MGASNSQAATLAWGRGDADGGYRYPVKYVNQVQRQQTTSLPDPVDPEPVSRNIGVYFTRLNVGGVDFALAIAVEIGF